MKKWLYWKTLALLIILSCFLGCGGDDLGDDGSVTDPDLDDGTQISTITIEKIRSEKVNGITEVWWRINANPPPKTDLAVRIFYDVPPVSGNWVIVPKHKSESETFRFSVWFSGDTAVMVIPGATRYRRIDKFLDDTVIMVKPLPMVSIVGRGVVVDLEALQKQLPVDSRGGHRIPKGFDFPVYKVGEPSQLFFEEADVIAPDVEPPVVTGGTIKDGEEDVDAEKINADRVIEVTFSEEVHGFIALQTAGRDDIGWIGSVDGMAATLKLVAGKELSNETTYVIKGRIFDAARNKLTFEITFTTRDAE